MERDHPLYHDRIVTDPAIMAGKPVVKGACIPVELVVGYLAENPNGDEFFQDYPDLTIDEVKACLAYAQALVAGEEVIPAPRPRPRDRQAASL